MLLTQDININEVAYAVGLDSTNFSRNFSKQFGLPPKKYIQKTKNNLLSVKYFSKIASQCGVDNMLI